MQYRANEAYLSALIDSTGDYIWAVDLNFKMVTFNRATAESFSGHFGKPLSPSKRHDKQLPPSLRANWVALYQRAISEGPFQTEYIFADGQIRDLSFNRIVVDGAISGISVFGKDVTARRAEEKAKLEAERKYREIFNGAVEGIFQTTAEGELLTVNPAGAILLGYDSPEELLKVASTAGLGLWVDPERRRKYFQVQEEAEVVRAFEAQLWRKDRTQIWASINSRKTLAIDGKTVINEGFIEDITDRKLAEMQILERDNKLKEAEDHAQLGHSSWDVVTNITTWSEGLYKITGWDRNQPPPDRSGRAKLYTPESWQRLDAAVKHSLAKGTPYDLELQIIRGDGALCWVRARGFASRDDSGKVNRLFGTLQDISEQKLSEINLRDSEERFRATFEQAAVGILHVSFEGIILRCNRRFVQLLGYSSEEVVGKSFREFTPLQYQAEGDANLHGLEAGHIEELVYEKPYIRKDGSFLWVRLNTSVQRDGDGQALHLVTFVQNINDRKLAEESLASASKELQASEVRHRTVFQTSLDALKISRLSDGKLVDVNKAFLELMGFQREEVIGRTTVELGIWANPSERAGVMDELRRKSSIRDLEVLFRRRDGNTFWGLTSESLIDIEGVPHVCAATRDLSDAKDAVKTIGELAFYDPVTHLPNRRSLVDLLETTHGSDPSERALLFLDLDNFKALVDALGHDAGDFLLQEAAQRLAACVRGEGTVARLGGDKFAIVLDNLDQAPGGPFEYVQHAGERILATCALPYMLGEQEWHCSPSIGVTMFRPGPKSGLEALQQGEIAVSQAKEAGRNTIHFFSPELQANLNARVLLESEIRKAIRAEEFELYFQPQVRGDQLIGSEALIHWRHPQRGILAPGAFIELAEDSGLILPLGDWVLWRACKHVASWAGKNGFGETPVAVNISGRQIDQPDFVARVLSTLDRTGANPENIKLELTETTLVKNFQGVAAKMTELKSHGLRFSVDDFGTGYSSLAYIKRLPLDQLKIDRAFVKDILADGPSGAIAEAIISMGRSMGFSVIAEGVETEEQRDFLIGIGCDCFQGYLYGRPLPAKEFERIWL